MQQLTASQGGTRKRYELVNEEYRTGSCRIGDLSGEQAAAMLNLSRGLKLSDVDLPG